MTDQLATSSVPRRRNQAVSSSGLQRRVALVVLAAAVAIVLMGWFIRAVAPYTVLAVAIVLLAAFLVTREYGYAVATGIAAGLGSAVLAVAGGSDTDAAPTFLLLFAAGFVGAWVLGFFAVPSRRDLWPLVPALVLGAIGVAVL